MDAIESGLGVLQAQGAMTRTVNPGSDQTDGRFEWYLFTKDRMEKFAYNIRTYIREPPACVSRMFAQNRTKKITIGRYPRYRLSG